MFPDQSVGHPLGKAVAAGDDNVFFEFVGLTVAGYFTVYCSSEVRLKSLSEAKEFLLGSFKDSPYPPGGPADPASCSHPPSSSSGLGLQASTRATRSSVCAESLLVRLAGDLGNQTTRPVWSILCFIFYLLLNDIYPQDHWIIGSPDHRIIGSPDHRITAPWRE